MRRWIWLAVLIPSCLGQQIPVTSVAGARFVVADLAKARDFYTKVFGLKVKEGSGSDVLTFHAGSQFLEFRAGESKDPLEVLYFGVGGNTPSPLQDPDGHKVAFVKASAAGEAMSLSKHVLHIGMGVSDLARASEFYSSRFAGEEIFRRPDNQVLILRMPGPREDWLEFIVRQAQGPQDHICLDIPDIQKAYVTLVERGATVRGKPRIASNGHWVINMADSNGLRVELMEPHPAKK
jgi:catechol 2,3-dioxygenase-like lactoylglutathione lyase family enzyme